MCPDIECSLGFLAGVGALGKSGGDQFNVIRARPPANAGGTIAAHEPQQRDAI